MEKKELNTRKKRISKNKADGIKKSLLEAREKEFLEKPINTHTRQVHKQCTEKIRLFEYRCQKPALDDGDKCFHHGGQEYKLRKQGKEKEAEAVERVRILGQRRREEKIKRQILMGESMRKRFEKFSDRELFGAELFDELAILRSMLEERLEERDPDKNRKYLDSILMLIESIRKMVADMNRKEIEERKLRLATNQNADLELMSSALGSFIQFVFDTVAERKGEKDKISSSDLLSISEDFLEKAKEEGKK